MSTIVSPIQIRLQPKDEERLAAIKNILEIDNTSEAVRRALEFAAWLLSTINEGGSVYLRRPDAPEEDLERVVILGAERD